MRWIKRLFVRIFCGCLGHLNPRPEQTVDVIINGKTGKNRIEWTCPGCQARVQGDEEDLLKI